MCVQAAIHDAQEVCEVEGQSSISGTSDARDGEKGGSSEGSGGNECAAAWDEAEELQAELARQKMLHKDIDRTA